MNIVKNHLSRIRNRFVNISITENTLNISVVDDMQLERDLNHVS